MRIEYIRKQLASLRGRGQKELAKTASVVSTVSVRSDYMSEVRALTYACIE